MTLWKSLPTGRNPPDIITVIVETPRGSKNKYEVSKDYDAFVLDRVLHSSVVFPIEYGMVPRTFCDDGDAIDAMVMISEPTFTGCVLEVRPIGLLRMRDEKGADDKVLTVATGDPRYAVWHELGDIPPHILDEISEFFKTYKHLEEGKNTQVLGWEGRPSALKAVTDGQTLFHKQFSD